MKLYGIWGSGGHGRETMPLVQAMESVSGEIVFVVDRGYPLAPINGVKVISTDDFLNDSRERYFNIAIADSNARERVASSAVAAGAKAFTIKANSSHILESADIAEGAIISPFASVTANAKVGRFFHGNCYSYVAHDSIVGDFVTLAPYACCNGGVRIGNHAYIGAGAILRNSTADRPITIGEGAVVGMGAVVTASVPPHAVVIGNPARLMKL